MFSIFVLLARCPLSPAPGPRSVCDCSTPISELPPCVEPSPLSSGEAVSYTFEQWQLMINTAPDTPTALRAEPAPLPLANQDELAREVQRGVAQGCPMELYCVCGVVVITGLAASCSLGWLDICH